MHGPWTVAEGQPRGDPGTGSMSVALEEMVHSEHSGGKTECGSANGEK